jgi:TonB-dependent receptor
VHLVYRITPNLQSRLSYSNSIGRPPGTQLLPTYTVNTTTEIVTLGNPDLKPQTSENWDATLEYYFEPVGQLSAGYFRKDLKDFLVTRTIGTVASGTDNGFGGSYAGFSINGPSNAGSAKIDGWELNYQQQFTFLPGVLRGLGFSANYTKLQTSGDYGETGVRSTSDVARFTPETLNATLSINYRGIGLRVLYSYMADTLWDYSTDASRLRYRTARELVNIGATYQVNRALTLSLDLTNAFNEPQDYYRALPERLERSTFNGTSITFGVSGRF